MNAPDLPGGRLALVLFFLGSAVLLCSGVIIPQFGDDLPLRWVVILPVWGAIAVFLGVLLRRAHPSFVKLLAQLWLSMAAGAVSYVWWIEHG